MKASVLMLAYNHEAFIAQAIESVLSQKVDFPFEVVIGEDCSTDRTRAIVLNYQAIYPQRVRVITSEQNVGVQRNFARTLHACSGQYIALLEGDDYWLSNDKLQKQVDFLDAHPECSMCAHNTRFIRAEDGQFVRNALGEIQSTFFDLKDILKRCFFQTSSAMFRSGLVNEFPEWYSSFNGVDWALFILLAHHGKIGYLNEVMSVYRIHPGGMWSGASLVDRYSNVVRVYQVMYASLSPEMQRTVLGIVPERFAEAAGVYLAQEYPKGSSFDALLKGGEQFLQMLLDQITMSVFSKKTIERKYWSGFYQNLGFLSFHRGDLTIAKQSMMRAIIYNPACLRNRGIFAVLGRSILRV